MGSRRRFGILTAGAILALVLIVADFILAEFNRSAQVDVNQRQQFINQGIELSRVNQALVRAIAVAAVRNNDAKLGAILTEQGITVTTQGAPASGESVLAPPASTHKDHP